MGFSVSKVDAFVCREDLNDPHAAAMWDLAISKVASRLRKDLNDPHAAAMWDLKISGIDALVGRKGLNDPHAAAMWDLKTRG